MPGHPAKRILLNRLFLVAAVFAFSQVIAAIVLHYLNLAYFKPDTWFHWDSGNYLSIATDGYYMRRCDSSFDYPDDSPYMCGNTGWFPGYPCLIRLILFFGSDPRLAGEIIAKTACFLMLYLVVVLAEIKTLTLRNFLFLCLAALQFGFIYYSAIFPLSVTLVIALSALYAFRTGRTILAGLLCFLIPLFYPTGFLLGFVFAIYVLINGEGTIKQKLFSALKYACLSILGLLAVFAIFQFTVGDWQAFTKVQEKFGNGGFRNPFVFLSGHLLTAAAGPYHINNFAFYQTICVAVCYLAISVLFFVKRGYNDSLSLWSYIYLNLFFFFPWSVCGNLSTYRAEAMLLPCVFIVRELKTYWLILPVIILVAVGVPMTRLFFIDILI